MVGRGYKVLCVIARSVVLAFVRSILRVLTGDTRAAFVAGVVESVFAADKTASLHAFVGQVSRSVWTPAEQELLFASSCEALDAASIPDGAIETFERASGGALHYSQEGEDIILARLLGGARKGFYVDVGGHHATRFSNTYALYRKGWRGLNIDATPGSMESFRTIRPNDVNLEVAISDRKEPLIFNMFREGALNTFDRELARGYIEGGWELKGTVELVPQTLEEVLNQHLEVGQKIDLLTVDVEGEDLGVLKSNDWNRYCPEIVIIEVLDTSLTCLNENPVVAFLKDMGFVPMSRLFNSIIFRRVANVCAAS